MAETGGKRKVGKGKNADHLGNEASSYKWRQHIIQNPMLFQPLTSQVLLNSVEPSSLSRKILDSLRVPIISRVKRSEEVEN